MWKHFQPGGVPSRSLFRNREIFANFRLTFVSSFQALLSGARCTPAPHTDIPTVSTQQWADTSTRQPPSSIRICSKTEKKEQYDVRHRGEIISALCAGLQLSCSMAADCSTAVAAADACSSHVVAFSSSLCCTEPRWICFLVIMEG